MVLVTVRAGEKSLAGFFLPGEKQKEKSCAESQDLFLHLVLLTFLFYPFFALRSKI